MSRHDLNLIRVLDGIIRRIDDDGGSSNEGEDGDFHDDEECMHHSGLLGLGIVKSKKNKERNKQKRKEQSVWGEAKTKNTERMLVAGQ